MLLRLVRLLEVLHVAGERLRLIRLVWRPVLDGELSWRLRAVVRLLLLSRRRVGSSATSAVIAPLAPSTTLTTPSSLTASPPAPTATPVLAAFPAASSSSASTTASMAASISPFLAPSASTSAARSSPIVQRSAISPQVEIIVWPRQFPARPAARRRDL